jgi:hypothetical protein
MTGFVEGIDPSRLALSPGHLARVEALLVEFGAESDTDGYYRCLATLSSESPEEVS